jgi:NAD(P)-dependent dehydrogenase (short-subunit alcohol dehydrogenase family)
MSQGAQQPLAGRVAIVTGASRGIGQAIAERLGSAGALVVVSARSAEAPVGTLAGSARDVVRLIESRGGTAVVAACDVESAESRAALIADTVRQHGRLDILVNNAGRAEYIMSEQMPLDVAHSQIEQYLVAPFDLSRLAVPHMRRQGGGWIVNIGSSTGKMPTTPGVDPHNSGGRATLYASLKAALHRMTASMAAEFLADRIAVNSLGPVRAVMTPGLDSMNLITDEMKNSGILERIEEIAEAALVLASCDPATITGRITFSYEFLNELGHPTRSLDGREVVTPR